MNFLKHFKSGKLVFVAAAIGAYIGFYQPEYIKYVEPFGNLYISILQMCILPILMSAISLSIGKLIKQTDQKGFLNRLVITFILSLLLASFLGTSIGYLVNPGGQLESNSLTAIGDIIHGQADPDLEVNLFEQHVVPEENTLMKELFFSLVPANIFNALSYGYTIKVLFFSVLFGSAIGALRKQAADHIFLTLDALYNSFSKLVQWLMYIFPFGICGLIAATTSKIGKDAFIAMFQFVPLVIVTFLLWFGIMSLVLKVRTGSFWGPLKALKQPLIISLSTSNTMASLPSALEAMHSKLQYDKEKVDLLVPLTFTLCRIGPTLYFSLATMFVVQVYNLDMNLGVFLLIAFGSVLAGTATAGSSGVSLLTMLGIVSGPLGLPLDAVLILFVVIDPIVAPFRVLAIVHSSCALITVILPKQKLINIADKDKEVEHKPQELLT